MLEYKPVKSFSHA